MIDTKQKILGAAERLIGDQGYAATSLRQIIGEAGVNLASVHYHFGSKEDLLDEVIRQKAETVNTQRLALLDRLELESGGRPVAIDQILSAFFDPMIETGGQNPQFVKLMGRLYAEGMIPAVMAKHFQPTITRFAQALRRAIPDLSPSEIATRMLFMIGAMSQAILAPGTFAALVGVPQSPDFQVTIRRLMVFLTGGLQAPPTPEVR